MPSSTAAHRLQHVGREHGIDQKARRALHRQRQLVDLRARRRRRLQAWPASVAGGVDHLDQRHHRHRVEEVDADQALRLAQHGRADLPAAGWRYWWPARRPAACTASSSASSACLASRFSKIASITTSACAAPSPCRIGNQAVDGGALRQLVACCAGEQLAGAREGRRDAFERLILQGHRHAAQRAPGGDVAAHDAGADDVHALERRTSASLPKPLSRSCRKKTRTRLRAVGERTMRSISSGAASALPSCFCPDVDDRVGRRVVLGPRAGGHLLAGAAGDDGFERAVEQALHATAACARGRPESTSCARRPSITRGGTHSSARPMRLALAGVDRSCRSASCRARRRARSRSRQAQHAAPAGEDAEHDFRQRHLGRRLVDDDAGSGRPAPVRGRRRGSGRGSAPASGSARQPGG